MDEISKKQLSLLTKFMVTIIVLIGVILFGLLYLMNNPDALNEPKEVEVDSQKETTTATAMNDLAALSEFIDDAGRMEVVQNCTNCHSPKLVTQNRMSREGWEATIKWMQETQNLWNLGGNQKIIVTYLAKNYGPQAKGRRQNLSIADWYELE